MPPTMTTPRQEEAAARRQHRPMERMARLAADQAERRRRGRVQEERRSLRQRLDEVRREIRIVERDYDRCLRSREMTGLEQIGNRLRGLVATEKRLVADLEALR